MSEQPRAPQEPRRERGGTRAPWWLALAVVVVGATTMGWAIWRLLSG